MIREVFTWRKIEATTWVASVPGGLLFRYDPSPYISKATSMVFVPCMVQSDIIKGMVDAYKAANPTISNEYVDENI